MHIAVKLELDKSASFDIPAFEPEEIDFWLNKAIRTFVKTRYSGVNAKQESFEQTQKRVDDLRTLVKEALDNDSVLGLPLADDDAVIPKSYIVTTSGTPTPTDSWPDDYMFAISEEVAVDEVNGVAQVPALRWGIEQCDHDEYREKVDNPYSEHLLHYGSAKPLRLFDDSNVRLVTDGNYTLSRYYLTYLREPVDVDISAATPVDCDLPEHTHDEVVSMAVNMMLENVEQPRLKSHSGFVATME